jgi:NADPH-dependent curcumin reductase CurA
LVTKRLKVQNFIVMDYVDLLPRAKKICRWTAEGKLIVAEDIIDGLEQHLPASSVCLPAKTGANA